MTPFMLSLLFGACAATLGGWALVRRDVRLQDFRMERNVSAGDRPLPRWHARFGLAAAVALCSLVSGVPLPQELRLLLWLAFLAAVSIWGWEVQRRRNRTGEMRGEWPVLLEGMSVAALSGLDLRSAFLSAARRTGGALRDELDKASVRLAGGAQLSRALEGLAKNGVPGAERLRSLLLQCEVLGTPVAEVLQALALEAATVERQEAEGRFNSLPLKMSIVTVLFLLPPVLIVSIAPHVLAFLNSRW